VHAGRKRDRDIERELQHVSESLKTCAGLSVGVTGESNLAS
jgi:hypothetical protein